MPSFKHEHIFFPKADRQCTCFLEEVRPGIVHSSYQIEGFPFAKRLDWYALVEPGERALFIDTGSWELIGTETLDAVVERYDVPWSKVEIAMTHFHVDHEESLQYCLASGAKRVYCGPQTVMTAADIETFGEQSGTRRAGDNAAEHIVISVGTRLSESSIPHEEVVLDNGDTISIAGYTLRAIYTPGHTIDHIVYVEDTEHFAFGGDHIIQTAPGLTQWRAGDATLKKYLDTFEVISDLGLEGVYLAHKDAFTSPDEVVDCISTIVGSYEEPLQKVKDILAGAGRPLTAYEAAQIYYAYKPEGLMYFIDDLRCRRIAQLFCYLEHLYDSGQIERSCAPDGAMEYALPTT